MPAMADKTPPKVYGVTSKITGGSGPSTLYTNGALIKLVSNDSLRKLATNFPYNHITNSCLLNIMLRLSKTEKKIELEQAKHKKPAEKMYVLCCNVQSHPADA